MLYVASFLAAMLFELMIVFLRFEQYTSGADHVDSGEIFTRRKDILFGTFRMRSVVPTVPGVVFGEFHSMYTIPFPHPLNGNPNLLLL